MSNSQINKKLNGGFIATLSFIALIRPVMSMLGISEAIGKPFASITATIIISLVWIIAVVFRQEPQPIKTLFFVGIGYGILAIVISGIFSPILTGHLQGPLTNPFAIISVLMTNAIWGVVTGILAYTVLKIKRG